MQAARATASEPQPNLALPPQRQQQPACTGGYGLRDSESDEEDPGEAVHHAEPSAEVSDFGSYEASVQSKPRHAWSLACVMSACSALAQHHSGG